MPFLFLRTLSWWCRFINPWYQSLPAVPSLKVCKMFRSANSKAKRHNSSGFRPNKPLTLNNQCSTNSFSCFLMETFLTVRSFFLKYDSDIPFFPSFVNRALPSVRRKHLLSFGIPSFIPNCLYHICICLILLFPEMARCSSFVVSNHFDENL